VCAGERDRETERYTEREREREKERERAFACERMRCEHALRDRTNKRQQHTGANLKILDPLWLFEELRELENAF
jgi:hypothetical protein